MKAPEYLQLLLQLAPETMLVLGALVVLFLDGFWLRTVAAGRRSSLLSLTAIIFTLGAGAWLIFQPNSTLFEPSLVISLQTRTIKFMLLVLTSAAILLSAEHKPSQPHPAELLALLLLGSTGLLLMTSARELISAFVALELSSICLYLLAGFNKQNGRSIEAALKYFLIGSVSTAFTLYGLSLLYGISGGTAFTEIGQAVQRLGHDPLLLLALIMTLVGFGFKIAAFPFHFWAPDAYYGAPLPSLGLIAGGSKVAGFYLFGSLLLTAFSGSRMWEEMQLALSALALLSFIVGNLLALTQPNLRRLIAYSAIAHAGYTLLGLLRGDDSGLVTVLYYSITYGLAVLGLIAVMSLVESEKDDSPLSNLAGLYQRSPLAACTLAVSVLSLAGIPPLAGFFGKLYLFLAAISEHSRFIWLVLAALVASVVAFYYYLQILKQAFVATTEKPPLQLSATMQILLVTLALAVLLLGCLPNALLFPLSDGFPPALSAVR